MQSRTQYSRKRPLSSWAVLRTSGLILAVGVAMSACSDRPTVEECTLSFRNFVSLNTGSILSEAELDRMTAENLTREMAEQVCVNKKSKAQVRCEIEAGSLSALRSCAR